MITTIFLEVGETMESCIVLKLERISEQDGKREHP
jgi:hypothetical protein